MTRKRIADVLIGGGGLLTIAGCVGFIFTILLGTEAADKTTAIRFLLAAVSGCAVMLATHGICYVLLRGE